MSIWIPPDSDFALALREPNLLAPGRKPTGNVKIDWSNPITDGLMLCYFVNGGSPVDLVSVQIGNDTAHQVRGGDIYYADNVPANRAIFSQHPTKQPIDEITVLSIVNPDVSTEDNGLFTIIDTSTGDWVFLSWLDTFSGSLRIGLGAGGDIAYSSGNVTTGKFSAVLASRKSSGQFRFFIDGLSAGTATATSVTLSTPNPVDNRPWQRPPFDNTSLQGYGRLQLVWNRQLSAEESVYISRNPFAFIKPANDTPYLFPVAGGGGVSVACGTGSLTLTGTNATIQQFQTVEISCGVGSITVTGSNATIQQGSNVEVACTTGSLTLTGVNASVAQTSNIVLATGSLSLTGANAQIEVNRNVTAAVGSLTLTGVNAVIDQQVAGQTNIVCTTGSITVTGTAAVINQVSNLSLGTGSIDVTGINASISSQRSVSLSTGSISLSGVNATIQGATAIACSAGAITITGFDITLGGSSVSIWTEIAPVSTTWTEI